MAAIAVTKEVYFTTSTAIDWVDIFTRPVYKHIVVESLKVSIAWHLHHRILLCFLQ